MARQNGLWGNTAEHVVNAYLGEVLGKKLRSWRVGGDRRGRVMRGGGYPDVLLLDAAGWPVAIEAKHAGGYVDAEDDANNRLGKRPQDSDRVIETVIALVYPPVFLALDGEELRNAISTTTDLEYALYSHVKGFNTERLPERGWMRGGVLDLAMLIHHAAVPRNRIDELAIALENGVQSAARILAETDVSGEYSDRIGKVLGQSNDKDGQTRRMAMTVLLNALVFTEALAGTGFRVPDDGGSLVKSPDAFWDGDTLRRRELIREWDAILTRNYWPIFDSAIKILGTDLENEHVGIPNVVASRIVKSLWDTAESLVQSGFTRSHDLMGTVFQRLIADRKFLATYYTRPEAAALLAGLALPIGSPPGGSEWSGKETLAGVQIGDFACGTGTLLSAAYSRLSMLYEIHGGDPKDLHELMMEDGLYGVDVLPVAVHLTATMLAGTHPDAPFDGERLLTMDYGDIGNSNVAIGSLELLASPIQPRMIERAVARTSGDRGAEEIRDIVNHVGHGKFDLVIMNPPFTRNTNHEAKHSDVPLPAYAAFETSLEEQERMAEREKQLAKNSPADGNAGLATYFTELAHRKVHSDGKIAEVLPLTALGGQSWDATRLQWRSEYSEIIAVTIAHGKSGHASFSSDTKIAECLVVAARARENQGNPRGVFVVLSEQPSSAMRGELIANAIHAAIAEGVLRLDEGSLGSTPIYLGDEYCGHLLDCPLPDDGPWPLVGVADVELAQVAYRLARGQLASIGQATTSHTEIPIARIGELAERGPVHRDIDRTERDGTVRGPFERRRITSGAPTYPMLWAHDAKKERRLVVEPDNEGRIKSVDARSDQRAVNEKADRIQSTATRAHYNCELRFNSQSLIVAMTERPCIGGTAWPSVIFANPDNEYAFALWSNSTLGLLLHWWTVNKTQSGRGRTTVTSIPHIPTLDVRALSDEQHARARAAFEELSDARFLPFDQIDQDDARKELDRALLVDVLGLPESLCAEGGPMEMLRRKIVAEPQIHGGKKSKVVFTDDGERTVKRSVAEMDARAG